MLPKISLFDELRKNGYEASLITTFNAYLPFYEEVILRRLVSSGIRHNVLMMDARQYAASLSDQPPRFAGQNYSLMPVKVGGAFHPKLIFLAGKKKGLVVIGSHNMTLAGFGFNRELTNVVRIEGADDGAGIAIANDVWAEVEHWLENFAENVPSQVIEMVSRVKEFAPWIKKEAKPDANISVLAGHPGEKPLWERLLGLTTDQVTDVIVGGAFFDRQLRFVDQIEQDLNPDRITIGIDPKTVDIPAKARAIPGVQVVHADQLGAEKEEGTNQYLHAKGILMRQQNGESVFACGSANPSSPAWMASQGRGNVELMLARSGDSAAVTAKEMGYAALVDMPILDDNDWNDIEDRQDTRIESEPLGYQSGVAVVDSHCINVASAFLAHLSDPEFVLCRNDGEEIARSNQLRMQGEIGAIEFPVEQLSNAFILHCLDDGELSVKLLLHHSRVIEEQSRTGIQRQFKDALLSLESDSPDIGLLIKCIDKILFSDEQVQPAAKMNEGKSKSKADTDTGTELGSLAIDVTDTKKRKVKQRLNHSGDIAYLLDTLIYHLRIQQDKTIEELDRHGRSEEEQVGADDEETEEAAQRTVYDRELLDLCHAKVRTVINRMTAQMKAMAEGKQSFDKVLVRLLGVLAILRELRRNDGPALWIREGETAVPRNERKRLLEAVMFNLFEGKTSLLHVESLGEEFEQSDDVARLKGLLLWLAWDCGLTLDLKKVFMEKPEQLRERLRQNAMVLALAQVIGGDDVVIDEARQSIGSLTTSEMDWLKGIQRVALQCDLLKKDGVELDSAVEAEPGDIAIHRTNRNFDLRIVSSRGQGRIMLIKLSKDKDSIDFTPEHLAVSRLS
ncbi:hypothetical protein N8198_05835 [Gammaproteobacteria bacterium]|nr:hypothetical protein [Gammaproteobacteria bacterium]